MLCLKISQSIHTRTNGKRILLSTKPPRLDVIRTDSLASIVFSSWKKSVTIIASLLEASSILYSIVEGSMSVSERKRQLLRFEQDPDTSVLLMTLGTGSTG